MLNRTIISGMIDGSAFSFRCLDPNDVNDAYVRTLKNEKRFIENNIDGITRELQQQYVESVLQDENRTICGLFVGESTSELAGTSGLQFSADKQSATIGILVFDGFRGKGLGKALIWLASTFAAVCGVPSFDAGIDFANTVSLKCFTACGFRLSATDKGYNQVFCSEEDLICPPLLLITE